MVAIPGHRADQADSLPLGPGQPGVRGYLVQLAAPLGHCGLGGNQPPGQAGADAGQHAGRGHLLQQATQDRVGGVGQVGECRGRDGVLRRAGHRLVPSQYASAWVHSAALGRDFPFRSASVQATAVT